jgi:serine/threonine protein kinase
MTTPLDCPGTEGWQSLLEPDLAPDQLSRWERHLQLCPACQDRLDRAADEEEEFRKRARRVGDPTAVPLDQTLIEFLERLQDGQNLAPALPTEPAELDYLRPSDRPDLLGTLGVYEVREVIGQGGMGVVLKAYEPALQRLVAIKVLAPALARSATARRRFTREAQAAAAVRHEHIVPIYGVHESDGLPYLVMQYVEGESLQARLDRNGPLDMDTIVRIGQQTALGLAAAHAQGLIHRDIKPANILLVEGGGWRVVGVVRDFSC